MDNAEDNRIKERLKLLIDRELSKLQLELTELENGTHLQYLQRVAVLERERDDRLMLNELDKVRMIQIVEQEYTREVCNAACERGLHFENLTNMAIEEIEFCRTVNKSG